MLAILLSLFHPVTPDGRLYAATIPIVPQARGLALEVPPAHNEPLKKGDVLIRIDPRPYEIEVQRLEAALAGENTRIAQLTEKLAAAEATAAQAKENLRVSESENDRQLREAAERAAGKVAETQARQDFAKKQDERRTELLARKIISQEEADRGKAQLASTEGELRQAQASQRETEEKLTAGGSRTRFRSSARFSCGLRAGSTTSFSSWARRACFPRHASRTLAQAFFSTTTAKTQPTTHNP